MRFSASQVKTYLDCNRKWYFEKVVFPDERGQGGAGAQLGTEVHADIEGFLSGGELQHELLAENFFLYNLPEHTERRVEWEFEAVGFAAPGKGFVDLVLINEHNKTILIVDHKTTKDWKYAKTSDELREDPQALLYLWALYCEFGPDWTYSFAHHVISTRKPEPERLTSITVSTAEILKGKKFLDEVLERMIPDSSAVSFKGVDPNYGSCYKFGKCPYWAYCKDGKMLKSLTAAPKTEVSAPDPVVYVDCMPVRSAVLWYEDFIAALAAEYEARVGEHYLVTKYNEGAKAVAIEAAKLPLPEGLVLRSSNPSAVVFENLVSGRARVVRAIR